MKKLLCFITALTISVSACQAQAQQTQGSVENTLNQLKAAVNQKDFSLISDYLSSEYKYAGMARPMSVNILQQVIAQFPKIVEIQINSKYPHGDKIYLDVTLFTEGEDSKKQFILDTEYRLISADISSISMGGHGQSSSNNSPQASSSDVEINGKTMPFILVSQGLMMVKASVNGREGNFMVDSGTPNKLMLNTNFQAYESRPAEKNLLGVSGTIETEQVIIEEFLWNGIAKTNVEATLADLEHLGRNTGVDNFAGTIGYGLLKDYVIEFDYVNSELRLWDNSDTYRSQKTLSKAQVLPFNMAFHLPIIEASIGDQDFRFGLDCGAESNMMEPEWQSELTSNYGKVRKEKLNGADKNTVDILKVEMNGVKIKESDYTMDFIFAKLFGGNHQVSMIDGLIGYSFLSAQATAINYIDNELYFLNN